MYQFISIIRNQAGQADFRKDLKLHKVSLMIQLVNFE